MKDKVQLAIEDLKKNRNYSLYQEIYKQNKNRLDNIAISYRGNNITYRELFDKVEIYSAALKIHGFKKGSIVPLCLSNTPEFIYMFLAISRIGAIMNSFGPHFDKEYLKEMLKNAGNGMVFVTDDNYGEIKDVIENSNTRAVVMFSLSDSLPLKNHLDPYMEFDAPYKDFSNHLRDFKKDSKILMMSGESFETYGKSYLEFMEKERGLYSDDIKESLTANVDLEDPFTITYTSGTTNSGRPKAVLHAVRSYMTLARFKDSDVSGMPKMKNVRTLAHIPTYSHTILTTSIIDPLYLGCTVCPEPIYDKDFFPYSIVINKPNMVTATEVFWDSFCKALTFDEKFKKVKFPELYIPIVVGEALSPGEEKFFNRVSREHKFGTGRVPFPISPVAFSIGGGTCESSGVFITLFKALKEKLPQYSFKDKTIGLTPLACANVDVIRKDGSSCEIEECGELVLGGNCNMIGYYNDPILTEKAIYKSEDGREYLRIGVFAKKLDKKPRIKILGRMKDLIVLSDGSEYPLYKIEEIVLKDTKTIMSCSVVKVANGNDGIDIVIHIEPQPTKNFDKDKVLDSVAMRLNGMIPKELFDSIYLRYRTNEEGFPFTHSGKRDSQALSNEGLENTISINDCLVREGLITKPKVLKMEKNDKENIN